MKKVVGSSTYFLHENLSFQSTDVQKFTKKAVEALGQNVLQGEKIVRVDVRLGEVAFLSYPGLVTESFPRLVASTKIDLLEGRSSYRDYSASLNPPILHRKELLFSSDHEHHAIWSDLTKTLEDIGAFDDPVRIGYARPWFELLASKGYWVEDHKLLPLGNAEGGEEQTEGVGRVKDDFAVMRHLTALHRSTLSAPVQQLLRHGLLQKDKTLFDYGCGRGGDVQSLSEAGYSASGWDPHYARDNPIVQAELANLGFVLNVIEDQVERREALIGAYACCSEVLSVAVMLANENAPKGTPYGDGVLTTRNTFQKYFTQAEFRAYLQSVLEEEAIPVSPGVCLIFKDKNVEQAFLMKRYRSSAVSDLSSFVRRERVVRERIQRVRIPKPTQFELHRDILEKLWLLTLELGREPAEEEIPFLEDIKGSVGSLNKAFRLNEAHQSIHLLDTAKTARKEDLRVYFAMQAFADRPRYRALPVQLQKDIRHFFGDYQSAVASGVALLKALPDASTVYEGCKKGQDNGFGYLAEDDQYTFASNLLNRQDSVVRALVGCAAALYGDPNEADLIKVHVRSFKVSFMRYDDFFGKAIPLMVQRVKIGLKNLRMDFFEYGGEYPQAPLYLKSRFMNEEDQSFAEQLMFDEEFSKLDLIDMTGYGTSWNECEQELRLARWKIDGLRLIKRDDKPDLDDPCGQNLTYRDLIVCGETQARLQIENLPKSVNSYNALLALAVNILDPVIDYFGSIKLTYGFCSADLKKHITHRIDPARDQHSAHELNRTGGYICERLGAACDFFVEDEDMEEVARWIMSELPYDRLYFYGSDRPIHVSFGPENSRVAYRMVLNAKGARTPKVF